MLSGELWEGGESERQLERNRDVRHQDVYPIDSATLESFSHIVLSGKGASTLDLISTSGEPPDSYI